NAGAGNLPHPTLDAIASEVAGKPVTAWCETSDIEWNDAIARAFGVRGELLNGFTWISQPVVYLAPRVCIPLRIAFDHGYRDVGSYHLSRAMLVLIHEAVHQRGVENEAETDCTALELLPNVARAYFGYHDYRLVQRIVMGWKTVIRKVAGRKVRLRVRTARIVQVQEADPDLPRLIGWAWAWHRAAPAAYQGLC
ncbi:MAG TPA: hypothetical protein VM737_11145, partial [Gemmatimonadota bacterium]|nr:hypothetical protein [Gemmatimonadota bacterium]